jgi:ATP-binding cassette subfamily C protein CydC
MKVYFRLIKLLRPYTGWMLLGILVSAITLFANITLMAVSGWFIASMALAGAAGVTMNYFSPAAVIRMMAIIRTAGRYAERLITHEATFRLLSAIRIWFYQKLEPLIPVVLEKYRSSDLFNRIQSDVEMLENFYIRVIIPVVVAILAVLGISLFISAYQLSMGLTIFIILLISGALIPLLMIQLGKKPGELHETQSALLRMSVVEGIQGMSELIVSGAQAKQASKITQNGNKLINAQKQLSKLSGLSAAAMILSSGIAMWLIVLLAIPLVREGIIQPAELAMLALFTLAAFESVIPLPEAFRLLAQIRIAANRLFELIDHPPAIIEPVKPAETPETFSWCFDAVNFKYGENEQSVLNDISLQLDAGKKLAIVGTTGSGKSTLIQLLLRHRLPQQGSVTLSGIPVQDYTSQSLHQWVSILPQQVYLFNSTIEDNIRLGYPEAKEDDINRVIKSAQLQELIDSQPDGIKTWVGETGTKLSGGQVKRVGIARALLKPHQLLILDEPSEGLDSRTAKTILSNIINEHSERALLMITHQPYALELFDEIIVMEQGSILERGSYHYLMSKSGRFHELYHRYLPDKV